jgi:hypothetical protein
MTAVAVATGALSAQRAARTPERTPPSTSSSSSRNFAGEATGLDSLHGQEGRTAVGTKKGAFILESDESRQDWRLRGPSARTGRPTTSCAPTDGSTLYAGGRQRLVRSIGLAQRTTRLLDTVQRGPDLRRRGGPAEGHHHLEPDSVERHALRRCRAGGSCSAATTAGRRGATSPGCASTHPGRSGCRATAGCACTRWCPTQPTTTACGLASRRSARSRRTMAARPGTCATRACAPTSIRATARVRPVRAQDAPTSRLSRPPVPAEPLRRLPHR